MTDEQRQKVERAREAMRERTPAEAQPRTAPVEGGVVVAAGVSVSALSGEGEPETKAIGGTQFMRMGGGRMARGTR